MPNILIHACKNITRKMNLLKMCGPQIRLCLLTFRPIASKQLNSLTTLVTLSWLGGAEVTHSLCVRGHVINSPPRVFRFNFLFCFCCDFTFCPKHIICHNILQIICNIYLCSMLNTLHDLWPITRVKRSDLASLNVTLRFIYVNIFIAYFESKGLKNKACNLV